MRSAGIVLSAGEGNRFDDDSRKQFTELLSKPVLQYSLELFESLPSVSRLIVVGPPSNLEPVQSLISRFDPTVDCTVVPGGSTRFESVQNGLSEVQSRSVTTLFLHDAARPGATVELCEKLINELSRDNHTKGVIPVLNIPDTVKRLSGDDTVKRTIDRNRLRRAQTPQLFEAQQLRESVSDWDEPEPPTDEAQLLEHAGYTVATTPGDMRCHKITYPEDLRVLEALLGEGSDDH